MYVHVYTHPRTCYINMREYINVYISVYIYLYIFTYTSYTYAYT